MSRKLLALVSLGALGIGAAACTPETPSVDPSTGGSSSSTGGTSSSGGTSGVVGGSPSSGGLTGTGGSLANSGGTSTGGKATGGMATGGMATGGTATGGKATGGTATGGTATGGSATGGGTGQLFSFFVTSLAAMQQLSGNTNGFGGDLRYGMTSGLDGADKICQTIATNEGFGNKTWHAFLSTTTVNAITRVGTGPWYDRLGRLVGTSVAGLIAGDRPDGVAAVVADLPNEKGVQEHTANSSVDDHDTLTGSNTKGTLYSATLASTCNDWTSAVGTTGKPMAGHHWPGGPSQNWIQAHTMPGCAPGVCISSSNCSSCPSGGVGCSGGYGAIYCFALSP